MPLARIITSQQHLPDHDELTQQLRAAGYEVEVAAPGADKTRRADLEIDLEILPTEQALEAAVRMADDGADVFIAPGVVSQEPAPAAMVEAAPVVAGAERVMADPPLPLAIVAEPLPSEPIGVEETRGPSWLQRLGAAWAERQQQRAAAAEERRLERERLARQEQERRRQQALELQRRREEEARARAERERLEREHMTREAVRRAERARQTEESEIPRAIGLPAQLVRRAEPPDPQRLAAIEAQMQPSLAAAMSIAASAPRPVPAAHAVAKPAVRPPRRLPSPRQRQWQRAVLLASLAALLAMLGFAVGMNMRPGAPLPSTMLENKAQQQVPFGPATIKPSATAMTTPASGATAGLAGGASPARKPRPSAAKERPVRQAPRTRHSADRAVADDEVVVRRYSSSNSERAQRTPGGIRRYSDQ